MYENSAAMDMVSGSVEFFQVCIGFEVRGDERARRIERREE